MSNLKNISKPPKQARAKLTYKKLTDAAQMIIATDGYDGLNSNAIAEKAGVTVPSFYRYFGDKFDILQVICNDLMREQNKLIEAFEMDMQQSRDQFAQQMGRFLKSTLTVTKKFTGGHVLLVLMRSVPSVRHIRLQSHENMADWIANNAVQNFSAEEKHQVNICSRLAIEVGYSVIEMLFETDFADQDTVINLAAEGIATLYAPIFPHWAVSASSC